MRLSAKRVALFQQHVWSYYDTQARSMPWREQPSFYTVLVSEVMLQQTQVSRVIPKYIDFMEQFPTLESLASASLADVLVTWQGLGYNRRAKYLYDAACYIVGHDIPDTIESLIALPGIGKNTAGAIMAYAYDRPTAFVETNIRTVYINEFFVTHTRVSDNAILELVAQTCDRAKPREWYYALMDYGANLKRTNTHLDQSSHFNRQSKFQGSVRELRGRLITALSKRAIDREVLGQEYGHDKRYSSALSSLIRDGLIQQHGNMIRLTETKEPS